MALGSTATDLTEVLSRAGYDWITFDLEHGSIGFSDLPNLLRATLVNDTVPFVRLPNLDSKLACKLLDIGFYGLILPNVQSSGTFAIYFRRDLATSEIEVLVLIEPIILERILANILLLLHPHLLSLCLSIIHV